MSGFFAVCGRGSSFAAAVTKTPGMTLMLLVGLALAPVIADRLIALEPKTRVSDAGFDPADLDEMSRRLSRIARAERHLR